MFRNYLTVALRNLFRYKIYSLINIFGLAVGIALCMLTYFYIHNEWNYDTFYNNADRIYLAYSEMDWGNRKPPATTPPVMASTLMENFPEIEKAIRFDWEYGESKVSVRSRDKLFYRSVRFADPEVFEMFSFPAVAGEVQRALQDPHAVVISRSTAELYFGQEDPLEKRLTISLKKEDVDFTVKAVVEVPDNSSIQFDLLLPLNLCSLPTDWGSIVVYTFFRLSEGVDSKDFEAKLETFFEDYFQENKGKWYFGNPKEPLRLLPITDLHFRSDLSYNLGETTDPRYVYILAGVALAILCIACANFINLSAGLSSNRFKEIGLRKVLGATRTQLGVQFWGEVILVSTIALLLGMVLAELLLPLLKGFTGKNLTMDYSTIWPVLVGLFLFISLVTGSFPVMVLSNFRAVDALKGRLRLSGDNHFSRILIILQFTVSIALLIATLTMSKQMVFLHSRDVGFDAEQVVVIDVGDRRSAGHAATNDCIPPNRRSISQYPESRLIKYDLCTPVEISTLCRISRAKSNGCLVRY